MSSTITWKRLDDPARGIVVQVDSRVLHHIGSRTALQIASLARRAPPEWFVDCPLPLSGIPVTARGLDLLCFQVELAEPSLVAVFFLTTLAEGEALVDYCRQAARAPTGAAAADWWYRSPQ